MNRQFHSPDNCFGQNFKTETIIYDNKEQNNDRLLDRHFLFSEIDRTTPIVPNNFVSSSRKKGISAFNETREISDSIYSSSLFNNSFMSSPTSTSNSRQNSLDTSNNFNNNSRLSSYNCGRGYSGWIDFSATPTLKKDEELINDNRLTTHIFDTLGHKHKNQGERPIAVPSNPWMPNS